MLAHGLLLGGAGAAIFLAGGAPQGNLGVYLLCAGVALVACPPRARVEWPLWAAAGGLVGCAGLAFLPARWMAVPMWRRVIGGVPAVTLPGTITAAPTETAFWLALLALSLVSGLFALAQPVRARGMIWLVLAAVTACGVYAALAMYAKVTGWHYPFSGGATFGFLPNRNHTATLLITGSVLAMGLMSVAFRDRRWVLADAAVVGALVCVAALAFFSTSRAGVLILLAGGVLWLAGLSRRHRPGRLLVVAGVVAVVAGGLFLAFKSPARDRLLEMAGSREGGKIKGVPTPSATPASEGGGSAVAAPRVGGGRAGGPAVGIPRDDLSGHAGDDPGSAVDGDGAGNVRGGVSAVPAGVAGRVQRGPPGERLADAGGGVRAAGVRVRGGVGGAGGAAAAGAGGASVLAAAVGGARRRRGRRCCTARWTCRRTGRRWGGGCWRWPGWRCKGRRRGVEGARN